MERADRPAGYGKVLGGYEVAQPQHANNAPEKCEHDVVPLAKPL